MTSALRSVLYAPASNTRALARLAGAGADAVILDLEDAVAPEAKAIARRQAGEAVAACRAAGLHVAIRVNAPDTPWGRDDVAAAVRAAPHAIVLPKVQTPEDIGSLSARIDTLSPGSDIGLWAMMETPRAMLRALEIADAARGPGRRLRALVLGLNDLARDTGMRPGPGRAAFVGWMADCVAAARANGLAVLDGVCNEIHDTEALRQECLQAAELGMDGKTLIHPAQVPACHAAFDVQPAELAWARTVVAAFATPAAAGAGALRVEGRMVERLHLDMAERLLARQHVR